MTERGQPATGALSIDVDSQREVVKVIPAGELDIATVGQLQSQLEELIQAGFARIVIDLGRIEFIDSSGLHALLSAHDRAKQEDWQLAIVPGRHAVQRIFEITGVDEQLPFTSGPTGPEVALPRRSDLARLPTGRPALISPVQQPRGPMARTSVPTRPTRPSPTQRPAKHHKPPVARRAPSDWGVS